ncbi:hypothetical protein [Streptomyces sp. NPDC046859]|uniref:hypothetical protein n=1 Tax=Streptomyces sp. NPDC046859 TaxID=3155734 RepID=UPI0033F8532A
MQELAVRVAVVEDAEFAVRLQFVVRRLVPRGQVVSPVVAAISARETAALPTERLGEPAPRESGQPERVTA